MYKRNELEALKNKDASSWQPHAWKGSYTSAVGPLYIPAGWHVRWSGGDANVGVGAGTLSLAIDLTNHRVTGTVDGPLGPATLDGFAVDGKLTATVARKEPADNGFTGTLEGSFENDQVRGTMNVSSGEASTIRTASFALDPTKP